MVIKGGRRLHPTLSTVELKMHPQQVNHQEPLWTAKDVADYLRASTSWVYLHAEDGTLPSLRIAGLRRFIPEQIRAFARGEAVPTSNLLSMSGRSR